MKSRLKGLLQFTGMACLVAFLASTLMGISTDAISAQSTAEDMTLGQAIQAFWTQLSAVIVFTFILGLNTQQLWSLLRRFAEHRKLYFKNREEDAEKQAERDSDTKQAISDIRREQMERESGLKEAINEVRETGSKEHQELQKEVHELSSKVELMQNEQSHMQSDIAEIKDIVKNGKSKH